MQQEDTNSGSEANEIKGAMSWDSVQEVGRFYPAVGHEWWVLDPKTQSLGRSSAWCLTMLNVCISVCLVMGSVGRLRVLLDGECVKDLPATLTTL